MNDKTKSAVHREGVRAFHAGEGDDACPYAPAHGKSAERIAWFNGYLEARIAKLLSKHGIAWP